MLIEYSRADLTCQMRHNFIVFDGITINVMWTNSVAINKDVNRKLTISCCFFKMQIIECLYYDLVNKATEHEQLLLWVLNS